MTLRRHSVLVSLIVIIMMMTSALAQDGSLEVENFYSILSSSSSLELTGSFSYSTTTYLNNTNSTTLKNSTTNIVAYFFSIVQPTVLYVDITSAMASINSSNSNGDLSLVQSVTITDPDVYVTPILTAGAVDSATGELYMASTDRVYHVFSNGSIVVITAPTVDGVVNFAPETAQSDQTRRLAFFPASSSPTYLYVVNFTIGNFTGNATLNTPSAISSAYDSDTGILYIGGLYGDMERFNTLTMQSEVYVSSESYLDERNLTTGDSLSRAVIAHSSRTSLLYVCTELGTGSIAVDVLDDTTLAIVNTFSVQFVTSITTCGSLALDDIEGEMLLGLCDSSGTIFSYDLITNTQSDYAVLSSDVSTGTIINGYGMFSMGVSSDQLAYMITATQIATISYASTCTDDCNSNGYCLSGNCTCINGWTGDSCDSHACDQDCNGNGDCANGECVCDADWTGSNCSTRQCSNNCTSHGVCSNSPDWTCACTDDWSGTECSTAPPASPPPACDTITAVHKCVSYKGCGWCQTDSSCKDGSIRGPYYGSCSNWTWNAGTEKAVIILACIFLAIIGLMFIFNAYSAIMVDRQRAVDFKAQFTSGLKRKPNHAESAKLWWRDQRSAKTWLWVEQLQFLVLVSHISLDFPTAYISFSRFFDWTNLGLPLPFEKDTDTYHANRVIYVQESSTSTVQSRSVLGLLDVGNNNRNLLGFEAYSNSLLIDSIYIFGSNMFWFAMALLGILVVYSTLIGIKWRSLAWRTTFITRMVHLLIRLMNMAYVGLIMTSAFAMAQTGHNYQQIVPGAFVFVIVGAGYPLLVFLLLRGNPRKLVDEEFKYKFGSLYTNFHPGSRMFALVLLGRKFFQAMIVGFLNYSLVERPKYLSIIQVVVMGVVQIGYTAAVFIKKPYYDYYHEYLEYFLCLVNLATLGLSMWQYNSPSEAGMLITGLVQVLGMVGCVGVYIVSWIYMNKESGTFFSRRI